MSEDIKRPALWLHLVEFWRALRERFRARHFLKTYASEKIDNAHPVFVIPGFMASQASTSFLRRVLDEIGYKSYDWGLGRNYARLEEIDIIEEKIANIYKESNQKISLIGWSLGGLYARKLAKARPELFHQVITLGAPYKHLSAPNYADWLFQLFQKIRGTADDEPEWVAQLPFKVPIPSVAIYSKTDGIVPWEACMDKDDLEDHINIEVNSSHIGMGMNQEVIKHVLLQLNRW